MAAGPITITGAWEDAEGEPASGTVSFQRHDTIQDVDVVIVANQVEVVQLEDDGTIDTEVIAADPDDPNPLARFFRVTERIRHTARAVVYDIEVDSDSDPVDLTTVARVTALPAAVYQYEVAGTTAIERERAMAAEEQLASDLAAEIARATAAEDALGALIEALSPDGAPVWPSVTAMLDPATDVTGGAFTTVDIWDTSGAVFVAGIPRSAIAAGTRVLLPSGPNVGIWVATASGPFTLADPQPAYGAIGGVNFGPDGPFLVVAGSESGGDPVEFFLEVSGIPATVARTNVANVFTEPQTVQRPITVVDIGGPDIGTAKAQPFATALDEDDTPLAGLFALGIDLGGGLVIKQAGVFSAEWDPFTGQFTGRRALVSYGFRDVDPDTFEPIFRFAFNIAADDTAGAILGPEAGILQTGTPVLDADVVPFALLRDGLATKADDDDLGALAADVSEAQADIEQLALDFDALDERLDDLEGANLPTRVDALEALPALEWQPFGFTDTLGQALLLSDVVANQGGVYVMDPAVGYTHELVVDLATADPLNVDVVSPGPGKYASMLFKMVNTTGDWTGVLDWPNRTTGASPGGNNRALNAVTVYRVDVYGGPSGTVHFLPFRAS